MAGLLQDHAVVITGAGRGIGRAYAIAAAAEGARVVVNDVDVEPAAETVEVIIASGGVAISSPGDVSEWATAGALIESCVGSFGRIDALINNAGQFRINRPEDQTLEDVSQVVGSSLIGTIACTTHAIRHMAAAQRGVILNVTSGEQMGTPAKAVYGAAKAGVATLTYSWADDLAAAGIRVNAISPNAHTRMADRYEAFLAANATQPNARQNVGTSPEHNAPLALYLLSDLSSGVTGQVIRMDPTSIMVCSHPAIIEPVIELPETFGVAEVADAMERLAPHFQPGGMQRISAPEFH